jgi:N-acetylglucosaminyl-diphospho-decaprenol L-rhamnosyltransferase
MTRRVLAVVVSYNNWRLTEKAVRSAAAQTQPTDVILWDNASTDGSARELLLRDFPPNVTMVFNDTNVFWTPALNKAVSTFWDGQDYLAFMNNDVELPPQCFHGLVTIFDNEPTAGMVAPMGSMIGGAQDYASHKEAALAQGISEADFRASGPKRCNYLVGACVMVRKAAWDAVGPLDEKMTLGADDHDYSIRLKHAGHSLWVDPSEPIEHAGHASGDSPAWEAHGSPSWEWFNQKWAGYYRTEEEAIRSHWNCWYESGWDKGTGWDEEIYAERVGYGS